MTIKILKYKNGINILLKFRENFKYIFIKQHLNTFHKFTKV